jgi:hypothetical protein
MKSRILLTGLSVATMLLGTSSLMQPAFALTKAGAYGLCAAIKFQQCNPNNAYHYKLCAKMGRVPYTGGYIPCCKVWNCGYIE